MQSVMKHQFSQVPKANIPRSVFNRSHGYKTTFDSGYLVPFYVDEALPGDTFNLRATMFARMSTPIFPLMDNMFMDVFYFAVPLRLLWTNFQKFMGEQTDPEDSTDFTVPQIVAPAVTGWATGTLSDYFGLPTGIPGVSASAFWHRAYNLIYNQWFRDQNMQDSVVVDTDNGPDTNSDYVLLKRGKRHDYFTSCLPWPQKGPGVELPLGEQAIVKTSDTALLSGVQNTLRWKSAAAGIEPGGATLGTRAGGGTAVFGDPPTGSNNVYPSNLYADLSDATAATINSLREAFQLQRLYERDSRSGSRYTEILRSHFGVISPDARLQRPEYLGGTTAPVRFMPVAQTSESNTTPQGTLSAFATITVQGAGFTKSFVEHCVILGLLCVRADLTYQQGLPRMFSRSTRWDFYWPSLAHLGEQAVLNKEIYCQGPAVLNSDNEPVDNDVFGYQERFAEYRYYPSKITGKLRSTAAGSLDAWHLSQEFDDLPTLSPEFIEENVPMIMVLS